MIFSRKNICITIALLLCGNIAFGYNFTFSNVTEKTLVICYKLEGLSQEYYQILMPDQSVSYYFPNLHCFGGSILWAEYKDKDALGRSLPYHGGIDLVDQASGEILKGAAQNLFKTEIANKYAFIPMQIKVVDNETFQKTVNAAEELAQGIDSFSCETINTVKAFINPGLPTGGGMSGGMNSSTSGDKKEGGISGAISNVINKIADKIGGDDKKKEITENDFVVVESTSRLNNLKELIKAHDAKQALFFMKRYKNDLLNIISESQFDSVYDQLNTREEDLFDYDYQDMLNTLNNRRGALQTPKNIDLNGIINIHMGMNTSSTENKNTQCRFRLGEIAKNGGILAGGSFCRDLHFVIVDTGEVGSPAPTKEGITVSRVKKPILIAEINQGG